MFCILKSVLVAGLWFQECLVNAYSEIVQEVWLRAWFYFLFGFVCEWNTAEYDEECSAEVEEYLEELVGSDEHFIIVLCGFGV